VLISDETTIRTPRLVAPMWCVIRKALAPANNFTSMAHRSFRGGHMDTTLATRVTLDRSAASNRSREATGGTQVIATLVGGGGGREVAAGGAERANRCGGMLGYTGHNVGLGFLFFFFFESRLPEPISKKHFTWAGMTARTGVTSGVVVKIRMGPV